MRIGAWTTSTHINILRLFATYNARHKGNKLHDSIQQSQSFLLPVTQLRDRAGFKSKRAYSGSLQMLPRRSGWGTVLAPLLWLGVGVGFSSLRCLSLRFWSALQHSPPGGHPTPQTGEEMPGATPRAFLYIVILAQLGGPPWGWRSLVAVGGLVAALALPLPWPSLPLGFGGSWAGGKAPTLGLEQWPPQGPPPRPR